MVPSIKEYTKNLDKLELYDNYMSMIHYDGSSNVHFNAEPSSQLNWGQRLQQLETAETGMVQLRVIADLEHIAYTCFQKSIVYFNGDRYAGDLQGIDKVDELIANIDSQSIGQTNDKFEGKHSTLVLKIQKSLTTRASQH